MRIAASVAQMSVHKNPLARLFQSVTTTADGVGIKYDGTVSHRTPTCQTIRNTSAVSAGSSTLPSRRSGMCGRSGGREQTAQMIGRLDKGGRGHAGEVARARQRDVDRLDDPAGTRREHDDPVGQER